MIQGILLITIGLAMMVVELTRYVVVTFRRSE
jgi:hypothetical protein